MPKGYSAQPAPTSSAEGTTYYVDAQTGSDSARGTSPTTAWRTLARASRGHYHGGDAILLNGGERFTGTISLARANLHGTAQTTPLFIGSYGQGRATIRAPQGGDGITALNVAGVRISRLKVVGRARRGCQEGKLPSWGHGPIGIGFEAVRLNGSLDEGIAIDHVDVSGFCNGIVVTSGDDRSRISGVRVTAASAHDNRETGVWTYDQSDSGHSIRDVTVSRSRAYRNGGRGGIALFGVDDGTVAHSVAFANGTKEGGGVGIWAFDSNRIRITHDTSYRNGSATIDNDGDGFDLDRGVTNSVIEHSHSYENGGVGLLVCSCVHFGRFYAMHNNTVRDNVSRNDGSSGQPSLFVLGGEPMTGIDIADNSVSSSRGSGPLVKVGAFGRRYVGLHFRDNSFVAGAGKRLLDLDPTHAKDLVFNGNTWRTIGGPFTVKWGSRQFTTERAWQAATGAEAAKSSP